MDIDDIKPFPSGPRIISTGEKVAEKFGSVVLPVFQKRCLSAKRVSDLGFDIMSFPVIYEGNQLVALASIYQTPKLETNLIKMQYSGMYCWISAAKPVASTFRLYVEYKTRKTEESWGLIEVQFNKGSTESNRGMFMVPIVAVNTEKTGVAYEDDTYSYQWDSRQIAQ